MNPDVTSFFHALTGTWTHVVADPSTGIAAIIDPVLDFEQRSGRTHTKSAQSVVAHCRTHELEVEWILETHAHADHITAAPYLQATLGGRIAIGEGIRGVQSTFKKVFGLGDEFVPDGKQFDHLFGDDERFQVGQVQGRVIATPGHTDDSISYLIGDAVFIGDTVFMPDGGSARCDFPGGDAEKLYRSVQRLYSLPPETRVYVCHDYPPKTREATAMTTIAQQRAGNTHIRDGVAEPEYVAMRRARDATLDLPVLLIPSIQVNIRAGRLPPPDANGVRYLKVPLDTL
jgi:glyoxylase-like metal-dependent hydrolase (beta-lactamase superfamily II)